MTVSSGGLGVLAANTESPLMTKTTVGLDFSHVFEVLTQLGIEIVGDLMTVLSSSEILLIVEEP